MNEGVAYVVSINATQNLYRFFNSITGFHFYTANDSEKDLLNATLNSEFIFEGVSFAVHSLNSVNSTRDPVYRFYDPDRRTHFYTANFEEIKFLENAYPSWINEGVAWYV